MDRLKKRHRIFLIDFLRIVCALLIYLRHSVTMFGCSYGQGWNDFFLQMTSPVMTCFFVLSGFSIHYQHRADDFTDEWTRKYLIKRLISIMPSYLLVVLIWPIFNPAQLMDWVVLLPVDLLGLQTSYRTLFGILHNGGTWFVSCILFCYAAYPVLKAVLGSVKKKASLLMLVIPHFLLIYSSYIAPRFSLDGLYSNPIARMGEFMIGAAFAEMMFATGKADTINDISSDEKIEVGGAIPLCAIMILGVVSYIIARLNNHTEIKLLLYSYMPIPIILILLFLAYHIRCERLEKSRILSVLSGMSYQFFLTQMFLWNISSRILKIIHRKGNNAKIVVSLCACTIISFLVWRFIDRPIKSMLQKRLLEKSRDSLREK